MSFYCTGSFPTNSRLLQVHSSLFSGENVDAVTYSYASLIPIGVLEIGMKNLCNFSQPESGPVYVTNGGVSRVEHMP